VIITRCSCFGISCNTISIACNAGIIVAVVELLLLEARVMLASLFALVVLLLLEAHIMLASLFALKV
jgi:hypothetical protein